MRHRATIIQKKTGRPVPLKSRSSREVQLKPGYQRPERAASDILFPMSFGKFSSENGSDPLTKMKRSRSASRYIPPSPSWLNSAMKGNDAPLRELATYWSHGLIQGKPFQVILLRGDLLNAFPLAAPARKPQLNVVVGRRQPIRTHSVPTSSADGGDLQNRAPKNRLYCARSVCGCSRKKRSISFVASGPSPSV